MNTKKLLGLSVFGLTIVGSLALALTPEEYYQKIREERLAKKGQFAPAVEPTEEIIPPVQAEPQKIKPVMPGLSPEVLEELKQQQEKKGLTPPSSPRNDNELLIPVETPKIPTPPVQPAIETPKIPTPPVQPVVIPPAPVQPQQQIGPKIQPVQVQQAQEGREDLLKQIQQGTSLKKTAGPTSAFEEQKLKEKEEAKKLVDKFVNPNEEPATPRTDVGDDW